MKELDNRMVDAKYIRAKNRVNQLKRYYTHLAAYVLVNSFISISQIVRDLNDGYTFEEAVNSSDNSLWFWWGIGIAFHTYRIFGARMLFMNRDWEDKKIKEYMNEK